MKKVSTFVFAVFILGILLLSISYIYIEKRIDVLKKEKYLAISQNMKRELQDAVNNKQKAILLITLGLSANQSIKEVLKKEAITSFNFDELNSNLDKYASFRHLWFHIIRADGRSFYRSWTEKQGDTPSKIRIDVAKILQKPQVMKSISVGKYDITFKAMVPVYDGKKFLGIVETIAKFYSITKKMKKDGYELLILSDSKYKKQLTNPYSQTFIGDYYVANPLENKKFLQIIRQYPLAELLHIKTYKIDTKKSLLLTTFILPDINGEDMAYFIIAKDLRTINFSSIERMKMSFIEEMVLLYLLVVGFIYYIISMNQKKFILKQNKLLEIKVKEKVKEAELQKDILNFSAHHDQLTGLPNKVLVHEKLEQIVKHSHTSKENFVVLFLDLDRFKEINDTYGHNFGDELLIKVTKRLQSCLKEEDTLARFGGDEFVIMPKYSTDMEVIHLIENIFEQMKKPFIINGIELYETFSIGIAVYDEGIKRPLDVLRNAETAMYKAKDRGRNSYQFYNKNMTEIMIKRVQLDADIRKALKNKEFVPYFQPKVDARSGKIVGLETLIRWKHPDKGIIYPNDFIPFCEEIGLITQIDRYMLIASMNQISIWQKKGLQTGKVSVNVSTRKLESDNYIAELKEILEELQFNTDWMELEILEGQIMQNPEKMIGILQAVKNLGISISVDDFGTGYSSLSYLKRLPIDKIKIDRSFVVGLPHDKDDVAITKTIIALAKNLKIDTIAEGVETQEQLDFLVQEGCYNIQGYYFSKPLSIDECEAFIVSKNKRSVV